MNGVATSSPIDGPTRSRPEDHGDVDRGGQQRLRAPQGDGRAARERADDRAQGHVSLDRVAEQGLEHRGAAKRRAEDHVGRARIYRAQAHA